MSVLGTKTKCATTTLCLVLRVVCTSCQISTPAQAKRSLERWDETGSLVFTSSTGTYALPKEDHGVITEDSDLVPLGSSDRTDKLLKAEQGVLEVC